jgi:Ca2+-binding RTX toxin-like protein
MRLSAIGILLLVLVSLASASTAANSVPATRAGSSSRSIGAQDLKPAACASLTLTNVVTGSGSISGTTAADLVLGSSGIDTVTAGNGNDCVVGGGGADIINGGAGTDVCIGGPGIDVLDPLTCETAIQ